MEGIWSLPTILSGTDFADSSGIAQIVFQFMSLGGVIFGCYCLPPKSDSVHNGFLSIRYSGYALIVWYGLTILDLFLHEGKLTAAYGYILLYFFIILPKFAADILILTGTLRVIACFISQRLDKPLKWIQIGEFFILILLMTALYHLGSYFANEVLWLNLADPDIIQDISGSKDQFEAAFFSIQWLLTLSMLATISAVLFLIDGESISRLGYHVIAATAVLWIRSFSEFIIVIHYHLQQNPSSSDTDAARDFVYGLCTSGFLVLIAPVAGDPSCKERIDPVKQLIEEDVRTHVMNAVNDTVEASRLPPVLAEVLRNVRQNPMAALSQKTIDSLNGQNPNRMVTEYVNKMQQRWGALRPVDRSREY